MARGSTNTFVRDETKILRREVTNLAALTGKELAEWAKFTAEALVRGDRLKTHQLRNIYAAVDRLRTLYLKERLATKTEPSEPKPVSQDLKDGLFLLLPKLAYAAGRQRSVNATLLPFMQILIYATDVTTDEDKAFANFFALLESVVGYHKYFENNQGA